MAVEILSVRNVRKTFQSVTALDNVELTLRAAPENQYTLSVRDQGVGLPAGFDVNNTDTLGLHLVNILSAQLGAALSVESNGHGTIFEVVSNTKAKPDRVASKSTR